MNTNEIIEKLFLKRDLETNELRIAKTKTFSIAWFIILFTNNLLMYQGIPIRLNGLLERILLSIITALIGALILYVIGWIISKIIN